MSPLHICFHLNSVIVKFSRLPFRYSQPDSRRPLPWLFHLHPSSKVVLLCFYSAVVDFTFYCLGLCVVVFVFFRGCYFFVLLPWLVRCGFVFSAAITFTFYSLGFSVVVFVLFRGCCFQVLQPCAGGTYFCRLRQK